MEHVRTDEAIRQRLAAGPRQSYFRDWVYGGIDGIVTTYAIVSGVVGARLSPRIILILGSASLIADGFAMAAGEYLATRSEHEEFHHLGLAKDTPGGRPTAVPPTDGRRIRSFPRMGGLHHRYAA
jgi:vacuolar iron transporter family protein